MQIYQRHIIELGQYYGSYSTLSIKNDECYSLNVFFAKGENKKYLFANGSSFDYDIFF